MSHIGPLVLPGITLRDLFAAGYVIGEVSCRGSVDTHSWRVSTAISAYSLADAMLNVRDEHKGEGKP
jgi:hypothetical protein